MTHRRASRRPAKVGRESKNEVSRRSLSCEYPLRWVAKRRRPACGVASEHAARQPFQPANTPCAFAARVVPAIAPIGRHGPPPYTYYIYSRPPLIRSPSCSPAHPAANASTPHPSADLARTVRRPKSPSRGVSRPIRRRLFAPVQGSCSGSDRRGPFSGR